MLKKGKLQCLEIPNLSLLRVSSGNCKGNGPTQGQRKTLTSALPTELQGQGPVSRKFFGWHNSLCIFKTKVSWGTKLCTYFYFSSLYNIWKDQLYRISRPEFFDFWEMGPRTGACHGYCTVAQLVEQGWSIAQVVGSNPTLVRLFLCPCVGTFPLQGLMLRGDKLGISKHCKLPINYLDFLIISATRPTF